ncbi:LysM peptidoglycan-binding domain-containing protein [Clostridium sp. WILCCON 0269]|uniref:LysM peptidoglycan-binding domain-containing protein n=1 Tax=Candidatus Clostridium eludens TaxID=3381663 RepID=A0ABW8SLA1_9CLOT
MPYNYYRQCPATHYPYTIQSGDTLNRIAYRLGVSVQGIVASNPGIDPYYLRVGQVICIPACPPNHTSKILQPGDTLYKIAQAYNVSVESILESNPGVDPNYLRVGQRLCIPLVCNSECPDYEETIKAMQNDINMLKAESNVQKISQSNYGNSTKTTNVLKVTDTQLQFDAVPVTFSGNYEGHYTIGKKYPYYTDAASGGQRGITVKDNFGVWHSFGYHVPLP